jgi:hypothetical protein
MAKEGRWIEEAVAGQKGAGLLSEGRGLPPVEQWNPPFCGEIDMRIAADGTWFYQGSPITRPSLVKLFSSILKKEGDKYVLVTPVEKVGLTVEEVPFLAVELEVEHGPQGQALKFRSNVDDWIEAGPSHALRFEPQPLTEGLKPFLHVRRDLWAKVTRALFYDLVALGEERDVDGEAMFGVASNGAFFPMAEASRLREFA